MEGTVLLSGSLALSSEDCLKLNNSPFLFHLGEQIPGDPIKPQYKTFSDFDVIIRGYTTHRAKLLLPYAL